MKLRNTIKMIAMAGLATMALPMTAQAALSFGAWDVTQNAAGAGFITNACPADGTCNPLVEGDGFLQQEYTDDDGTVYIHTIVTDSGLESTADLTTLAYRDESFVKMGGTENGIAAEQSIYDASKKFTSGTQLYTGWADADGVKPGANLIVTQSFDDLGVANVQGDEFSNSFELKVNLDAASGEQTGKEMRIDQTIDMGDGVNTNSTDIQRFLVVQMSGDMQVSGTTATPASLFLTPSNEELPPEEQDGGTVYWEAGDDLMLVWLGQKVSDGPGSLSVFGFESINNKTVASLNSDVDASDALITTNDRKLADGSLQQSLASTFSTSLTGGEDALGTAATTTDPESGDDLGDFQVPFAWDVTFGDAPTLPAPDYVAP